MVGWHLTQLSCNSMARFRLIGLGGARRVRHTAVGLALLALYACSPPPEGTATLEAETRAACQQAILSQLEASAGARFAEVKDSVFGPAAETRDIMRLLTYVDGRNDVRRYFQCDCNVEGVRCLLRQVKEVKR